MKNRSSIVINYCLILIGLIFIFSCTGNATYDANSDLFSQGEILAKRHCASCHQYVDPDRLPTKIWNQYIMPQMGHRIGVYGGKEAPDSLFERGITRAEAAAKGIFPEQQQISNTDWQILKTFYSKFSSDSSHAPTEPDKLVTSDLHLFRPRPANYSRRPPLTTMLKILPEQQALVFADGKKNVNALIRLDKQLELDYQLYLKNSPVSYLAQDDKILLLSIGQNIFPSDSKRGELELIYSEGATHKPNRSTLVIDSLRRPVHLSPLDFNQDGREDYLICEFGNLLGSLSLFENQGDSYQKHVLIDRPGATKTQVSDLNNDGWPDIIVLMAQGLEGIFLLSNQDGTYQQEEPLVAFSPLAGSTYFETVDWDNDNDLDLLYTCGDNADISIKVKDFHGIYLFENKGANQFTQSYFFPMPGAYKALARDFDQDGDLDISAISFFPDYASERPLHFVYLEQESPLIFGAHSFAQAAAGRWMVMDAGDIDQDGDVDIALGSFVGFYPEGDQTGLYETWVESGPAVTLLENLTVN